jgi:hypothetical protein
MVDAITRVKVTPQTVRDNAAATIYTTGMASFAGHRKPTSKNAATAMGATAIIAWTVRLKNIPLYSENQAVKAGRGGHDTAGLQATTAMLIFILE